MNRLISQSIADQWGDAMERTVSATEARVHFGELMRDVVENENQVIVERDGKPLVVILAKSAYDQLCSGEAKPDWRALVRASPRPAAARLGEQSLPVPDEIIRRMREERDAQIRDLR